MITKDGVKNIPSNVISQAYEQYAEGVSAEFGNAFKNRRVKEMFKHFYRK